MSAFIGVSFRGFSREPFPACLQVSYQTVWKVSSTFFIFFHFLYNSLKIKELQKHPAIVPHGTIQTDRLETRNGPEKDNDPRPNNGRWFRSDFGQVIGSAQGTS